MKVFTYKDQPWDNVDAWRLGEACRKAAQNPGGDYIDGGLELLKQLQDKGFGVVKLEAAQHPTSAPDSSIEREAFEAWYVEERSMQGVKPVMHRHRDGGYYPQSQNAAWLAWQARAAIAAKEKP